MLTYETSSLDTVCGERPHFILPHSQFFSVSSRLRGGLLVSYWARPRSPICRDQGEFNTGGQEADKADMAASRGHRIDIISSADGDFAIAPTGEVEPVSGSGEGVAETVENESRTGSGSSKGPAARRRLWVGVHFECCGVYQRIYREPEVPFYEGQCPQCGRRVTMRVGPDGVSSRIFKATPI
jgi:hypothetical protein